MAQTPLPLQNSPLGQMLPALLPVPAFVQLPAAPQKSPLVSGSMQVALDPVPQSTWLAAHVTWQVPALHT
jgi:hypothetical protein